MIEVPCRVSIETRQYEETHDLPEPSDEDVRYARQELEEEILAGKRIGRFDLEAIIDQEINDNYAATLRKLYEHFAGIATCGDSAGRCLDGDTWMLDLVRKHMPEELVQERAERLAAERFEGCCD